MEQNREVAKILERQHIKHVKHFYRSIAEINLELANIHRAIEHFIDKKKYQSITDYVNQYISYTSVWNVKFVYNLESPEVALLQIFHLDYIFSNEPKIRFKKERNIFIEQKNLFNNLKPFKEEHVQMRKQKMLDYIHEIENPRQSK